MSAPRRSPATQVLAALHAYRFRFGTEADLQQAIAGAFSRERLRFTQQVRLGPGDVIDFVVELEVGVELKVKGSQPEILRQLSRYTQAPSLTAVVLVTRKLQHARAFPTRLGGKPVHVVTLEASSL